MHTLTTENSDSLDGKCSLTARSTQPCLPETWAEQGAAPTSRLALHALLVEDQCNLLQQFVHLSQPARKHTPVVATSCRSCPFPRIVPATWHVGLASHLQCFMSGTFCHCAMPASCAYCIPHVLFKMIVTYPHCVLYCIP